MSRGLSSRSRISEEPPARNPLKTANFNKDSVYTRCILLKSVGFVVCQWTKQCKNSCTDSSVPIHQLVGTMNVDVDVDVIEIFPAVHALTGCETSCKIRTKAAALKTAEEL